MKEFLPQYLQEPKLSNAEVFTKIWLKPKMVFKFINAYRYENYMILLLLLLGIVKGLDRLADKGNSTDLSMGNIIVSAVLIGGITGWIGTYIYAVFISLTGPMFDGKATTKAIFRILAYAYIPTICSIFVISGQLYLLNKNYYEINENLQLFISYALLTIEIVLSLWTAVLCVVGLAEVQKITYFKAFLNLVVPFLMFVIPILVCMFMATLIR